MNKKTIISFILIFSLMLFLDQFIKYLIINNNFYFSLIDNLLSITYEKNYGIAFSLFENNNLTTIIISIGLILYLVYIIYKEYIVKNKYNMFLNITMSILFAGIVGNLIDRIFMGYVIDYIDLSFFAVFNLADIFITYGVIVLLYKFIKE